MTPPILGFGAANPEALLRNMVRETGRATVAAVTRKISQAEFRGAEVTFSSPGAGSMHVHIDGDAPGASVMVNVATWEFFQVGQRVLVALWPPSGVAIVGGVGAPPPWQAFDPQWTGAGTITPTIHGVFQQTQRLDTAIATTIQTATGVDVSVGDFAVVQVAIDGGVALPTVLSITNTGAALAWTLAATHFLVGTNVSGYYRLETWTAYVPVAITGMKATVTADRAVNGMISLSAWANTRATPTVSAVGATAATTKTTAGAATNPNAVTPVGTGSKYLTTGVVLGNDDGQIGAGGPGGTIGWAPSSGGFDTGFEFFDDPITNGVRSWWGDQYATFSTANSGSATTCDPATAGNIDVAQLKIEVLGHADNPILSAGVARGYYRAIGRDLELRYEIAGGAGDTYGTGQYSLYLPPGFRAAALPAGSIQNLAGILVPAGSNRYRAEAEIAAGAAFFDKVVYQDGSTTYWGKTNPVAFTTSGKVVLKGTIEFAPLA